MEGGQEERDISSFLNALGQPGRAPRPWIDDRSAEHREEVHCDGRHLASLEQHVAEDGVLGSRGCFLRGVRTELDAVTLSWKKETTESAECPQLEQKAFVDLTPDMPQKAPLAAKVSIKDKETGELDSGKKPKRAKTSLDAAMAVAQTVKKGR